MKTIHHFFLLLLLLLLLLLHQGLHCALLLLCTSRFICERVECFLCLPHLLIKSKAGIRLEQFLDCLDAFEYIAALKGANCKIVGRKEDEKRSGA